MKSLFKYNFDKFATRHLT